MKELEDESANYKATAEELQKRVETLTEQIRELKKAKTDPAPQET